jgi:predicted phage terminase large subunit-like protein
LPSVQWGKFDSETSVDKLIAMFTQHSFLYFWAEKGHISQSIGPFLKKRMLEEEVYCAIIEKIPSRDKMTRAQSIHAMASMGRVRFPTFAPWWSQAETELLQFPESKHDDFVDALSWIGIGVQSLIRASPIIPKDKGPKEGTLAWIKDSSKQEKKTKMLALGDGY